MRKVKRTLLILLTFFLLIGCSNSEVELEKLGGVYYEIFVASFNDGNNDHKGDLKGVSEKLDYLDDLGISGIWLMPVNQSTTYHKYDVVDYMKIDEEYGNMADFEELVTAAKSYDIDIIMDLVLNHTSSQHEWFIKAKQSLRDGTCDEIDSYCDYYNFTKIKQGNYYPVPGTDYYYEAVFWDQMPDLNLDSENVRREIEEIVNFWMNKGIKGFRLDAIMHFYNSNTSQNVEFLKWFSSLVKSYDEEAVIVGEAWTTSDSVSRYYAADISCFNFDLAQTDGRIASSIRKSSGNSLAKWIVEYHDKIRAINENSMDSIFISNHDQGRSAAYFATNEPALRLMATTYLWMSGRPYVYYGEELGMLGSGIDENKRLPFIWDSADDSLQCQPPVNADYASQIKHGLKQQSKDKTSLYNHYKNIIKIRNQHSALLNGKTTYIESPEAIYMVQHTDENETILVIHNFSNEEQQVEIRADFTKLDASVSMDGKASFKDGILNIPAYGSVIME